MAVNGVEILEGRRLLSAAISFAAPTVYVSGQPAHHLTFGDFTNDGFQDIAVPNPANNSVTILINNGQGAFTKAKPLVVQNAVSAVAGDFTGDGNVDLAVLTTVVPDSHVINLAGASSDVDALVIYKGNGDGTFTRDVTYRVTASNGRMVVGDFNHDGRPDIAFCTQHVVAVLINQGGGAFAQPTRYRVTDGEISYITTGDFNGDGNTDLVVAVPNQKAFRVLTNNGNGTFTVQRPASLLGTAPVWLAVGDFNGDGNQDVAAVDGNFRAGIFLRLGNGTPTFSKAPLVVGQGAFLESIAAADFTGSGTTDLAEVDFTSNVRVVPGNGDGTFAKSFALPGGGTAAFGVFTEDVNNDGKPDIVALSGGNVYVYLNTTS
jgi:hypothetical protein